MNDERDFADDADQLHVGARRARAAGDPRPRVDLVHDTDIARLLEGEPEPWC